MSIWPRLAFAAATVAIGFVPATSSAQSSPADKADQLNDEGKKLFGEEKYLAASKKFEQAIILSPEGRYYFNLCFTMNFLERYQDALEACRAVQQNGGDARLIEKTNTLIVELEKRVPPPVDPGPGTGTDPGTGSDPGTGTGIDPGTGSDPGTGTGSDPGTGTGSDPGTGTDPGFPPPGGDGQVPRGPANPFVQKQLSPDPYRWSIGGDIGGVANLGIGAVSDADCEEDPCENYGSGGFHFRLHASFVLNEALQFGLQPYLQYTDIEDGVDNIEEARLQIIDLGSAVFLHRPLPIPRLYWTPLIGAHISIQQPTSSPDDNLVALGLRAEVSVAYLLGSRGQHAITITPGFNLYTPSSTPTDSFVEPEPFGLDKGSATFAVAIGYTARFSSAFGSSPLITLE